MTDTVFTIGHSTHSIERFLELLKSAGIGVVSDVRSRPYSRVNPQFNRETLQSALRERGIKYVFLGNELGARSDDQSCYLNGQVQYERLAESTLFKQGIDRIEDGARKYQVALMCAEKEPLDCHRTILVARELIKRGLHVKHVLGDGSVEDHEHTLERLIQKLQVPGDDMFRSKQAAIDEAYAKRGKQIAYRLEGFVAPPVSETSEQCVAEAST
jgi:uncharacterized protein (DUF488 family)